MKTINFHDKEFKTGDLIKVRHRKYNRIYYSIGYLLEYPTDKEFFSITPQSTDYYPKIELDINIQDSPCLLYTSPSPRDRTRSRMPSSA